MDHKKRLLLVVLLFLLIAPLSNISAESGTCKVDLAQECLDGGFGIIVGMSGLTNAHAEEVINNNVGDYEYALCCDFSNGIQPNSCNSGERMISLSSDENAHSEIPTMFQYQTEICETGLTCRVTPAEGYHEILSFSANTNAHIGVPGTYTEAGSYGLYCSVNYIGPDAIYCGDGQVNRDPEECTDPECTELCDTGPDWLEGGNCISPTMSDVDSCTCRLGYDPENFPLTGCEWIGGPVRFWSDSYEGATKIVSEQTIVLGFDKFHMVTEDFLETDPLEVIFEVYERDPVSDDAIRTVELGNAITVYFDGGKAIANWTPSFSDIENAFETGEFLLGDQYEFYFTAAIAGDDSEESNAPDLEIEIGSQPPCELRNRCMDYSDILSCENDVCAVAEDSVESIDCSDPDYDCSCWWDAVEETCGPAWSPAGVSGSCQITETVDDNCDDLFLSYSWFAEWFGIDDAPLECTSGEAIVPCPAQVELPFFTLYNLIIVIVIIALIYWLLDVHKKAKKPKSKKKIKKKK